MLQQTAKELTFTFLLQSWKWKFEWFLHTTITNKRAKGKKLTRLISLHTAKLAVELRTNFRVSAAGLCSWITLSPVWTVSFQQLPMSTEIVLLYRPYLSWILIIHKSLYRHKKIKIKVLTILQSGIKYKSNTQETRFWTSKAQANLPLEFPTWEFVKDWLSDNISS